MAEPVQRPEKRGRAWLSGPAWRIWYRKYLRSLAWSGVRAKVMRRAKGLCEGCGEAPATDVHHLTYTHVGAEFMFELVALCRACHVRWHAWGKDGGTG